MIPNDIDTGKRKLPYTRSNRRNGSFDFNPWLLDDEHIARRSTVLGIELELEKAGPGLTVAGWRKRK